MHWYKVQSESEMFAQYYTEKKVCYFDTKMCVKVMSPVLTHLHTCQIVRCVKTTHVLTGQCAG